MLWDASNTIRAVIGLVVKDKDKDQKVTGSSIATAKLPLVVGRFCQAFNPAK